MQRTAQLKLYANIAQENMAVVKEGAQACCAGDGKGGVLTCMVVTGRGDGSTNFKREFKSKVLGTLGKKTEKYQ